MNENAGRIFLHFHFFLPFGKLVVGQNKAFLGFQNKIEEVSIGGNGVKYLTSEEYNSLSHDEKMKDVAYLVPDMNQELTDYHYSNPNLLINADFRRPVNTNGCTEYSGLNMSCVDCWYTGRSISVKLVDGGLKISRSGSTGMSMGQHLEFDRIPTNTTITYSQLLSDGTLLTATGITPAAIPTDDFTMMTLLDPSNTVALLTDGYWQVACGCIEDNTSKTVVALKLELGSTQTLAHKEGDIWVLNDPINYELQYALCAQYNSCRSYKKTWIGYPFRNENLLDNWYFLNPINQRMKTEYIGAGYTIDRWKSTSDAFKLKIENSGIRITATGSSNVYCLHIFEKNLPVGTYTLSALVSECTGSGYIQFMYSDNTTGPLASIDGAGLFSVTANANKPINRVVLQVNANSNILFNAVKAELGNIQTLAHKEYDTWVLNEIPNYATELLKCKRYYETSNQGLVFPNFSGNCTAMSVNGSSCTTIKMVEKRITPNVKIYSANNGTLTNVSIYKPGTGYVDTPAEVAYGSRNSFAVRNIEVPDWVATTSSSGVCAGQFHWEASADL